MTWENALWPSCCVLQVHDCMIWSCTMQTKFTSLCHLQLLDAHSQKMPGRLFHRGGTVPSSARCLGRLCQLPGDAAHLATKRLSSSTSPLPQETRPRAIPRAFTSRVKGKGRGHYPDARIRSNQEQQRRGSLTEKQVLELSSLQTPIFQQCNDIWTKYL